MRTNKMTDRDRADLLFNLATFEKFTTKGLSGLLADGKVAGRSKVKTREQKIELLMSEWGHTVADIAEATKTEEVAPIVDIEAGDRKADADLELCLPFLAPIARRWTQTCQSENPNIITLIAYKSLKEAPTSYLTYAADARKLSRALDRPCNEIHLRDYSLPIFYMAKTEIGMYADQLFRMGIELVII